MTLVAAFAAMPLLRLLSFGADAAARLLAGKSGHRRERSPLNAARVTKGGLRFRKELPSTTKKHRNILQTQLATMVKQLNTMRADNTSERHTMPHEEHGNK
jgi:hypothetical protein